MVSSYINCCSFHIEFHNYIFFIFLDYDLVHLFTSVLLEDPAVQTCTELRVMYYQMASLFVYHTPNYVHMGSAW